MSILKSILKSKISKQTVPVGLMVIAALLVSSCSSSTADPDDDPVNIRECEQTNTCDDEMEMDDDEMVVLPPIIKPVIPADQREPLAFDSSYVYQSGSQFSEVLRDCYIADLANACDLATLPFLGMSAFDVSVNSIMARTVVTHDWMGLRFSQFLARLPVEALDFFKPITVIYIGSDINFTSFDATQGKLEIPPDNLWLTFGEKSTAFFTFEPVEQDPDATPVTRERDELQFRVATRLMRDDLWLLTMASANERDFEDIYPFFAYNVYRSAAFAFDRLGAPTSSNTALSESPLDVFNRSQFVFLDGMATNPAFTNTASGLVRYAEIYYRRSTDTFPPATTAEKQATANFIGNLFAIDGRLELFSYFSPNADFQDLFAAGMMKFKHGIHVDFGVLEQNDTFCDAEIAYAVSNRVASETVVPRLRYLMETFLGQSEDLTAFFESGIGVAEELPVGVTWCDSVPDPFLDSPGFVFGDEIAGRAGSAIH